MPKRDKDPFSFDPKGVFKSVTLVVLFFDVVGFTKNTTNDQMKDCIRDIEATIFDEWYETYNWNEKEKNEKNDLILIPTGDGYSIAFHPNFSNRDILDISKKFYCRLRSKLQFDVRMGIAKGPCQVYQDQNEKNNVFGYGINLANRVMGLARDNQILIHEDYAKEILRQAANKEIHEIRKKFEVKHHELVGVYNYYGQYEGVFFGNEKDPEDPISLK